MRSAIPAYTSFRIGIGRRKNAQEDKSKSEEIKNASAGSSGLGDQLERHQTRDLPYLHGYYHITDGKCQYSFWSLEVKFSKPFSPFLALLTPPCDFFLESRLEGTR
jgi:hypothetical protein